MGFFLEKAIFVNRAPFDRLELDFKERGINVLSGINGRGKTTILSYIVDAFHELARPHFSNSFEGRERKFYRFSSPVFALDVSAPSMVYLRFHDNEGIIDYLDLRGSELSESFYCDSVRMEKKIPFNLIKDNLKNEGFVKFVSIQDDFKRVRNIFLSNIATYFPAYRYEEPSYLTDPYKITYSFSMKSAFSGYLPNPLEVRTGLSHLSTWIMDVVLDWLNYKTLKNVQSKEGAFFQEDGTPERIVFSNVNSVLNAALSSKIKDSKVTARFGLGRRSEGGKRISVVLNDDKVSEIAPNVNCLSSGELALLCIFGEMLRQGDVLKMNAVPKNISGLVLIDEVDKHLHIKLQKEVLPRFFELFPNVQFIVSSHSPFLTMGLADTLPESSQIIDLDNGGISSNPRSTEEYEEVYRMMISENKRFAEKYRNLEARIIKNTRPLVITEGKTDIKHILKAKEKLGLGAVDFERIELECQPNGDGNLEKLLEQLSKIRRERKIIGIFDRDNPKVVSKLEAQGLDYKNYGNNVYAFCIQAPEFRKHMKQDSISIEFLYSDEEITSDVGNGTRLFIGTEFSRKSMRHNTDHKLLLQMPDGKGQFKILENNGGQAVYNENEENVLAKKDEFADAIISERIVIQCRSWENFRHIFEKIGKIIREQ